MLWRPGTFIRVATFPAAALAPAAVDGAISGGDGGTPYWSIGTAATTVAVCGEIVAVKALARAPLARLPAGPMPLAEARALDRAMPTVPAWRLLGWRRRARGLQ